MANHIVKELKQIIIVNRYLILMMLLITVIGNELAGLIMLPFLFSFSIFSEFAGQNKGARDFLFRLPIKKTRILWIKYISWLLYAIPLLTVIYIYIQYKEPEKNEINTMLISFLIFMSHYAIYDCAKRMMKDMIIIDKINRIIEFFIAVSFISIVFLFIFKLRDVISDDSLIVYGMMNWHFQISLILSAIVMYSLFHAVKNTKSTENRENKVNQITQWKMFKAIFLDEIKYYKTTFYMILGIGFLLQIILGVNKDMDLKNEIPVSLIVMIIGGIFLPFISYSNGYSRKNIYRILTMPVKKRTIILSYGAASLFYLFLLFIVNYFYLWLIFPEKILRVKSVMELFLINGVAFSSMFFVATSAFVFYSCASDNIDKLTLLTGFSIFLFVSGSVFYTELYEGIIKYVLGVVDGNLNLMMVLILIFSGLTTMYMRR